MHVKTRGQKDAISDINGPMGEGGNEKLIPAYGPEGTKGQQADTRSWDPKHKENRGQVSKSSSLNMQEEATRVTEGQEDKEGSHVKRSKKVKVTDLPVAI